MTVTNDTIWELERCLRAMRAYKTAAEDPEVYSTGKEHAAAKRASMDATRALTKWRQTWTTYASQRTAK